MLVDSFWILKGFGGVFAGDYHVCGVSMIRDKGVVATS